MAMRCSGRARFAAGTPRAFVLRSLALMVFRAVDLPAVLRGGDFFSAAVRTAARDVGFFLAIDLLPLSCSGGAVSTFRGSQGGLDECGLDTPSTARSSAGLISL